MEKNNYKYVGIDKFKLKWNGDLESLKSFIADDLNLSGKGSSPGGQVKAFTNENETSGTKQVEEVIYKTIKQKSSSPEQEMCSRFENSNLHNNDKHSD